MRYNGIYLSGSIRHELIIGKPEKALDWRHRWTKKLEAEGYTIYSPLRNRDDGVKDSDSIPLCIARDKADILKSDIILVNYLRPSDGTVMEIMYAYERDKIIIVVNNHSRSPSLWLSYHSAKIVNNFTEALEVIKWLN